FYSVGRNMDELGNFGHVSVPIIRGAWLLFTAEEWRIFSRLRLVLPICPMTSCFINFYFFGMPNIALLLGGPTGSFYLCVFFLLLWVTYLLLGFTGGL